MYEKAGENTKMTENYDPHMLNVTRIRAKSWAAVEQHHTAQAEYIWVSW